MKKWNKSIKFVFDNFFWYILYTLPLIVYIVRGSGGLSAFFDTIGLSLTADNVVLNTLVDIFGTDGVFPAFASNDILVVVSWFVYVFILHLAVDFLLFIPRLSHKYLGEVYDYEEH